MHRIILLLLLGFLVTQCTEQKKEPAGAKDKEVKESANPVAKTNSDPESHSSTTDRSAGIIGTWKLQLDAFDDNNNALLDPEERAKATGNNTSYQFKPDGSCVIQGMFKGRYELNMEKGHKNVVVYREKIKGEEKDDPIPEKFRILSVSASELVLLMQQSYNDQTIWIFKRV